jgi:hypothetical protein
MFPSASIANRCCTPVASERVKKEATSTVGAAAVGPGDSVGLATDAIGVDGKGGWNGTWEADW